MTSRLWTEYLRPLVLVAAIVLPFRSAIADWNYVPTGSMVPTIIEGDRIFVDKLAYDLRVPFTFARVISWSDPQRGDIVVLFSPADGERLVKRVVGLPGDVIELRNNRLWINGVSASYTLADGRLIESLGGMRHAVAFDGSVPARHSFGRTRVPAAHYFVLGDNRDHSKDSRYFGFVPRSRIVGRANTVLVSLNPEHYSLPRADRFLHPLQ